MNEKKIEAVDEHLLSPQDQIGFLVQKVGLYGDNDRELSELQKLSDVVNDEGSSPEAILSAVAEAWEIYRRKLAGVEGREGGNHP
jgi:hypothetical protein